MKEIQFPREGASMTNPRSSVYKAIF